MLFNLAKIDEPFLQVGIFFKYAVKSDSLYMQYHVNGMDLVSINDETLPSKCLLVHSDNSLLGGNKSVQKNAQTINIKLSTNLHCTDIEIKFLYHTMV